MRSRYGFLCQPKAISSCRTSLPISAKTSPPMPCRCASSPPERAKTILIARSASSSAWRTITRRDRAQVLDFRPRTHESCEHFTTVLMVPTGIDADIGGHAGDAGPVARLLAAASDRLITHPNVVNGADINEMPENTLYVEGSVLTRLMMGTAGLAPVRANRVLPLVQEHPEAVIWHTLVNAVSAAYGTGGFPCLPVVPLPVDLVMTPHVSPASGRATGVIEGFDALCELIEKRLGTFEAIAISSVVDVPEEVQRAYFMGDEGNQSVRRDRGAADPRGCAAL